jgi:competence protein ComEC
VFRIHFLDVGHGDTAILEFDNGRIYIVDYREVAGKLSPLDYLIGTIGAKAIETIIITHPHRDHFRGIQKLLNKIPVRQIWLSDTPFVSSSYREFEHLLETRSEIRVFFPRSGGAVAEGKDRIHVLAPPTNLLRGTHADINNMSIVLKVTIVNQQQDTSTSMILGADAEIASWNQILIEHGRHLDAGLLKVSHHGSQHGTDPEAIAAIRPQYSVISTGPNPFGHPDPATLELIETHTSDRIFRTDVDGSCIFESDGMSWNPV